MRKLKLDLDALAVQAFNTTALPQQVGLRRGWGSKDAAGVCRQSGFCDTGFTDGTVEAHQGGTYDYGTTCGREAGCPNRAHMSHDCSGQDCGLDRMTADGNCTARCGGGVVGHQDALREASVVRPGDGKRFSSDPDEDEEAMDAAESAEAGLPGLGDEELEDAADPMVGFTERVANALQVAGFKVTSEPNNGTIHVEDGERSWQLEAYEA